MDMGGSYLSIVDDVINLLKEHSLQEARVAIQHALKAHDEAEYRARSCKIDEINKNISILKRQVSTICQLVDSFPVDEQIYIKVNIQDTVDFLYKVELCELKALKRRLSKPG